ncbi:probable disease resistance rpp8-like protein 2 [Phtheirospermum japonicum]|uniref:Probable disease resistance rpp8-like protein 2 n=1 Tax=Phtheirospermum japonicum TaxID=374723 RepID=A0A830BUA8_9LAMI|nr:probable disease resistance rpp8-like protein 2 [Phtheirospermum japonicum]
MADAAISFAVEKLGSLLIHKVDFLLGVEDKVKWLKDELERMQCFLKDASEKQAAGNERIRKWISDIRGVAQDAEDAIETFILRVENPRKNRGLLERCACFPLNVHHLNRVGEQIESIKARLQDIEKSRVTYGIQDLVGTGGTDPSRRWEDDVVEWRRRLMSPWQNDKHVVGLKEEVELLLKKAILDGRESFSVATIVGMGGIGKTTLARKLYNHPAVADGFERRAWVCVSSDFRPRGILMELMLQLLDPKEDKRKVLEIVEKSPLPYLHQMVRERLQGKRYFIALDDVWDGEHWEFLATAFPNEDKSSRLLLTSRSRDIASSARYVHEMKILDPDQSWELFLTKAFIDNTCGKCPGELESIGREILRKCNGLPLAIIVIGGLLLKQRQSPSGWEKVLKEMKSRSGSSVFSTLELSYHNLPPQLKSCFLCLGFFEENSTIRAEKLTQVWIAQGLIRERGGDESLEDIARDYLDELINRNLVQVKDLTKYDQVKTCHIHDLLRELSIEKAKEEISYEIVRGEVGINTSQSLNKSRHRTIHFSTSERFMVYSKNNNQNSKHVRSLFFHGSDANIAIRPSYWKSFELLRILDFEGLTMSILPDAIGALIGLRYLGLRECSLDKLPSSFGRLVNLEVLDIHDRSSVSIPNVLWKMTGLRHLYMYRIGCETPLKIDTLKNLRTLSYISVAHITLEHLSKLTSLCELGIWLDVDSDVRKLCGSFAMLENLVCLNLNCIYRFPSLDGLGTLDRLTQLKLQGPSIILPTACNFPPNLLYLTLVGTRLINDPMPVLEKLPKLLCLEFDDVTYNDSEMVITRNGFPRLKLLSLSGVWSVGKIRFRKGAMAELKQLEINGCRELGNDFITKLVKCLGNLQALKMVTTPEIASKLRGEEAHVINKISSVEIIVDPTLNW